MKASKELYITPASVMNQMNKLEAAVIRAQQIAGNEKKTICIGTSILRPCKMLIDLWAEIDDGTLPVTIRIVPFDDSPAGMDAMLETLMLVKRGNSPVLNGLHDGNFGYLERHTPVYYNNPYGMGLYNALWNCVCKAAV